MREEGRNTLTNRVKMTCQFTHVIDFKMWSCNKRNLDTCTSVTTLPMACSIKCHKFNLSSDSHNYFLLVFDCLSLYYRVYKKN